MDVVSRRYAELRAVCAELQPGARDIEDLFHDAIIIVAKEGKETWSEEQIEERVVYRCRMLLFRRTQESKRIVYANDKETGKAEEDE